MCVELTDGTRLAADLVVIATGIRPNADIARAAGIQCNRGIIVNDYLETSDPRVFAVTSVALFAVALLACWLPARRAARLNPLEALRTD